MSIKWRMQYANTSTRAPQAHNTRYPNRYFVRVVLTTKYHYALMRSQYCNTGVGVSSNRDQSRLITAIRGDFFLTDTKSVCWTRSLMWYWVYEIRYIFPYVPAAYLSLAIIALPWHRTCRVMCCTESKAYQSHSTKARKLICHATRSTR
jgi:hypothetical protein